MARYHGTVDDKRIIELKKLARRLPQVPFDLTEKNKSLLRQLESKETRAKLLFLPERLLNDVATAPKKSGRVRFVDAQCAIALDILLCIPLRPQNLCALNWKRHFQHLDGSRGLLLHIPAAETKSKKKDLDAVIP